MPRIRTRLRAVTVVAAALVLTACASAPPAADAEIIAEISCAGSDPLGGDTGPRAGAVPEGFVPVAVVRCLPFQTAEDGDGVWSVTARERLEGDLAPLLAAQNSPDDPPTLGACALSMIIAPQLWLTDAGGRGIRIRFPADGCGQPKVDLIEDAIAKLDVVRTDEDQRVLAQPRDAVDAGCEATWPAQPLQLAPVEDLEASTPGGAQAVPAPDPGVTGIPWAPPRAPAPGEADALTLCAYSTDETAQPRPTPSPHATAWTSVTVGGTAWFTGSRRLDADETRLVLEAVANAQPSAERCHDEPRALVVLHADDGSAPITVELDGCRRLVVDPLTTYQASPQLIGLLAR
ncbi:hypothetical protein JNB62_14665 [Microbacterium jejuense]|uniref:Uncharacterized protein n=1 Tax=Microbacterium jejuense TaxID=1263637 RepID=A0ABS7HRC0_9MICO|nr:hypothetical protein [Microbacterium jejuense]MBW9094930.1 hypothetical protein [Microbacterium jejuense]